MEQNQNPKKKSEKIKAKETLKAEGMQAKSKHVQKNSAPEKKDLSTPKKNLAKPNNAKENTRPKEMSIEKPPKKMKLATQKLRADKTKTTQLKLISFAILASVVCALVLLVVWDLSITFDVVFAETQGVAIVAESNQVSHRRDFAFSLEVDETLHQYTDLFGVYANGELLEENDGRYVVRNVKSDLYLVVHGYGTAGLTIEDTVLVSGINQAIIVIPHGVTEIKASAFENKTNITDIFIPDSVKTIGKWAFFNNTKLANIRFSKNLHEVGFRSLEGTAWLTSQPSGIIYIEQNAYLYKGALPQNSFVTLQNGTRSISERAFAAQSGLMKVEMPNSVRIIGNEAFAGCENLNQVVFSNAIEKFGLHTFQSTAWHANQADGLIYVHNWVYGYKGFLYVTELRVRDGVVGIAGGAFQGLVALNSLVLPSTIVYLGELSFYNLQSLKTLVLPSSLQTVETKAFHTCLIESVEIPKSVKNIAKDAWYGCQNITTVTIKCDLKVLPNFAFSSCNPLSNIVIDGNIKTIESNAFYHSNYIRTLTIRSNQIPTIKGAGFLENGQEFLLNIFVLPELVDAYREAAGWSRFTSKIVAIPAE